MVRTAWVVMASVVLATAGGVRAAEPAGNYKLEFPNQGKMSPFWIVSLEKKEGKWAGAVVASAEGLPPGAEVGDVKVTDDKVSFLMKLQRQSFGFEGKLPKEEGKRIYGSIALGRQMVPAQLDPTQLKALDAYELSKELVTKGEGSPEMFDAVFTLVRQASDKKATPQEVRNWANKAFTAAELYGPRWQREVASKLAEALAGSEGLETVSLEYARKAHRLLDPEDEAFAQIRVLNLLATALTKAKKEDEAKEIEVEADKMYLRKMPPYKPVAFEGRKKEDGKAVLVELFTGAQCPPCVAADLAFDGLEKTYKDQDVILLQYHLHIPGPDPLTNEDTVARSKYYDEDIEGTPTILFNGKLGAGAGGSMNDAEDIYRGFREAINPQLEKAPGAKLKLTAARKGDKIDIAAIASDVEKSDKARLRLALVEEQVRYTGGNQLRFHHRVVRSLPGGAEGVAVKDKAAKQEITVDVGHVRESLNTYLNEHGKKQAFPNANRPLNLKDLYVVAFVQDDATKEVLQSVQVKVEGEK